MAYNYPVANVKLNLKGGLNQFNSYRDFSFRQETFTTSYIGGY